MYVEQAKHLHGLGLDLKMGEYPEPETLPYQESLAMSEALIRRVLVYMPLNTGS